MRLLQTPRVPEFEEATEHNDICEITGGLLWHITESWELLGFTTQQEAEKQLEDMEVWFKQSVPDHKDWGKFTPSRVQEWFFRAYLDAEQNPA